MRFSQLTQRVGNRVKQRIVPFVNGVYGKIVKLVRGNPIVISDASDQPLQGLRIFGKSTQNGTPTPDAPVEIVSVENPTLTICGKNLIDISQGVNDALKINDNGTYTITKISSARRFSDRISIFIPAGTKFCFNYKLIEQSCTQPVQNQVFFSDETTTTLEYGREISYEKDIVACRLYISVDDLVGAYAIIRDYQIEIGGTVTDYESFINCGSLSLPITLHGIPVTSGGNYTDANGQQWICDEVDFERGVYVQRIGMETKVVVFSEEDTAGRFVANRIFDHYYKSGITPCICNVAKWLSSATQNHSCCVGARNFYYKDDSKTLTEINELFSSLVIQTVAALSEPIETPLTADQIEAYKSLHTNEPNTTISNDQNAWMEVGYINK